MKTELEKLKQSGHYDAIKDISVAFFYWWYNEKGNNTVEGFDDWLKTKRAKELIFDHYGVKL